MKCSSCGAEIKDGTKFCEFCGSKITHEMKKEQEQLEKKGCPKCGSSNIQFKRENRGEIRNKKSKQVIYKTVGFCKDCGFTWNPNLYRTSHPEYREINAKIYWFLGWIFLFPIAATVFIWRKKNTWNKNIKIVLTVILWFFVFLFFRSDSKKTSRLNNNQTSTPITAAQPILENHSEPISIEVSTADTNNSAQQNNFKLELEAGIPNEYSNEIKFNQNTDSPDSYMGYFVPAGTYKVTNLGNYPTQVTVYTNETHITEEGWEEPAGETHNILLDPGEYKNLDVGENQYIKLVEPSKIRLEMQ